MQLTAEHQRLVTDLWSVFDRNDVEYVVLRGYEQLPQSIPGSDIDCLVTPETFQAAIDGCLAVGLSSNHSHTTPARPLLAKALADPTEAALTTLRSPGTVLAQVKREFDPTAAGQRQLRDRHMADGDLDLHLVNHLAYQSPMNGARIRVDPRVETSMIDRRKEYNGFTVPAPPDELAHLVCRGVFDYDGSFPDYYECKCEQLVEIVTDDNSMDEQFRTLLSQLFFSADELVYDLTVSGEYQRIRRALYRFSDY